MSERQRKIRQAIEMQNYCMSKYQQAEWKDRRGALLGVYDWIIEELFLLKEKD